jgi:hypothetical protein
MNAASAEILMATRRGKSRAAGAAFAPSEMQRAFVAAAAGLGLGQDAIRGMLPAEGGGTVEIEAAAFERHFAKELQQGLKLALSRVVLRVFERALCGEDREALRAQLFLLETPEQWQMLSEHWKEGEAAPPQVERLSRPERERLRKLLAKMVGKKETRARKTEDRERTEPKA